jgi:hypothetical protein
MSFVYVIAGRYVKIGQSRNPKGRLDALKTGSPYPLSLVLQLECDGAEMAERIAHGYLCDHRLSGEWFDVSPDEGIEAVRNAVAEVEKRRVVPFQAKQDFSYAPRLLALAQQIQWAVARYFEETGKIVLPSEVEGELIDLMHERGLSIWDSAGTSSAAAANDELQQAVAT